MKGWAWLHPSVHEERCLNPYRVRADAIMVATQWFMTAVCLVVAAFNGSWGPAVLVGLPTLALSWWLQQRHAGQLLTRLYMACAFMAYTSLLIHQSAGDIEAHFSAFGLIGVLLYYRDWRTIAAATVFIYLQHLVGGYLQSQGLPIRVFDTPAFWPTFALHVAYFLPFVGMMGYLSVWLHHEGVEQQRIIERVLQNEQALREATLKADVANRLKGQFLANMSHEIRTPLNGVTGMIQLLMDTPLSDEQKKALLVAQDSSRHLLMLLNDILDISRIEAGAMELTPVPVDVRQLWRSLHMNFEPGALAKGLALEMVCDDSVPVCLSMDLTRLRQICINLISNAIKYTPSGWIKVSARFEADEASVQGRLLLEVRDTGIGVPAHMAESIFSPFVQVDNSYSRSHAGAGLGLAITRGLVDLMGGSIHVTSDPGAGACFRVSLPCPVLVSPTSTPGEGPVSGTPLRQPSRALKVLVAEDHPVNQKVIEQMLRKLGHAPTLAADGQEALEWLQRQKFDLLLLDVMMPRLDGLQVLSLWRHQESAAAQRLPIVMVTAHAMTGDAQRFLEAGADGYLAKPLSMDRLAEEIVRQIPAQSR